MGLLTRSYIWDSAKQTSQMSAPALSDDFARAIEMYKLRPEA